MNAPPTLRIAVRKLSDDMSALDNLSPPDWWHGLPPGDFLRCGNFSPYF